MPDVEKIGQTIKEAAEEVKEKGKVSTEHTEEKVRDVTEKAKQGIKH